VTGASPFLHVFRLAKATRETLDLAGFWFHSPEIHAYDTFAVSNDFSIDIRMNTR